ncbi:MAG TPA: hypothetical protein VHF25_14605 [Nitriliruptorales bacterium]|nr:hypothetical protein [Nitriliruptorales bacterium]
MAPDERIALYARLAEVLGDDHARTLMSALPPSRTELATRTDVEQLGQRLDAVEQRLDAVEQRLDRLDGRMDDFHGALREQTRTFTLGVIGSTATVGALAFAAASIV